MATDRSGVGICGTGGDKARNTIYAGSSSLDGVGWYEDNSGNTTHPVGQKTANELGLHDTSGVE